MVAHNEQLAQGAVLVTVNQRLARHCLARYQSWQLDQNRQWWESPTILPLRAWLRNLHEQMLAAGLTSRTLLSELLQKKAWRHCIESVSGQSLLDIDAATAAARTAWDVSCAWDCHNSQQEYLSLDQFTWQRWSDRYRHRLEVESWVDESSLADHLVEVIESAAGGVITTGSVAKNRMDGRLCLPETLILAGFLQLPPQLVKLVAALESVGVDVRLDGFVPVAVVHEQSYPDDDQELLGIANHMRFELEHDLDQSLGLVVPELQKRRSAVMRAFDRVFFPGLSPVEIAALGRPYDLSLGMPLSDTPLVKTALSLIRLCLGDVYGSEISAVVLSPYLLAADDEMRQRERLDRRLREERFRSLDVEQLREQLDRGSRLKPALDRLMKIRRTGNATLSEWAARFDAWLKLLGWSTSGLDSEEHQAASIWLECLDSMEMLDEGERHDSASAFSVIRQLTGDRIFQPETPRTPIQIMGHLESHGIAFDCLWVAGLDTEQWPETGSPSPFLSISEQKKQGIPSASANARLALAEREFLMWASQSSLVIVSHAALRDGKQLQAADLPKVQASAESQSAAGERIDRMASIPPLVDPVMLIQASLQLESVMDIRGPVLPSGSEVRGGARLFENQALCPFRAFALHRLLVRPLEEAGMGLDPRQHGTLLHYVLELFWDRVRSHEALDALCVDGLDGVLSGVIDEAIEEQKVPAELRWLEKRRLLSLLDDWLRRHELRREAFEVVSIEQSMQIEHGGIRMKVVIDRIDRVDGSLVVLDYKTGTGNSAVSWADRRIMNPQLPLYVLTDDRIRGAAFAQVARNQSAFKGVAERDGLLPGPGPAIKRANREQTTARPLDAWDDWRAHWREALDVVAAEVRQGLASVTPMKSACTHCELKALCRVDEVALAQFEDDVLVDGSVTEEEAAS